MTAKATVQFAFRVSPEVYNKFVGMAKDRGLTQAALLTSLLAEQHTSPVIASPTALEPASHPTKQLASTPAPEWKSKTREFD